MYKSSRPDPVRRSSVPSNVGEEALFHKAQQCVAQIPLLPPKEVYGRLEEAGYRGQEQARKAVALTAYRHVKRLKQIFLEGMNPAVLPPKTNLLFIGPTGCGKTFLVELLFKHILKLPTIIVDITGFSETGYVGEDIRNIFTRLLTVAGGNPYWAGCGIIGLDEFDKLAGSHSNAVFAGQGTTKDVSGFGVQKELLRVLEEEEVMVPLDFGYSHFGPTLPFSTRFISYIACGAFSGFKALSSFWLGESEMGFRKIPKKKLKDKIAYHLKLEEAENVETFQSYGFLPELISRFTRIVPFFPLDEETLEAILVDNVIEPFRRELEMEKVRLVLEEAVLDQLVKEAMKRQSGARGLVSLMTRYLEEAAFEVFGSGEEKEILLSFRDGKIVSKSDSDYGSGR